MISSIVNVGPNLAKKFIRESDDFYKFLKGSYNDSIFLYNTNCEEISKVIDKMACKSSCGVDGISSKVVRDRSFFMRLVGLGGGGGGGMRKKWHKKLAIEQT